MNKNYKDNNKIILLKNSHTIILFIFLFLLFTILYILFQIFIVYNIKINPQIDQIAREDIILKKDLVVIDELKTEEEKKIFLQDIPAVYSLYDSVFYSQWNDFDRLFTYIFKERSIPAEIERYIKNQTEIKITDNRVIPLLILISDNETLIKLFRSFLYSIYSNGITKLKPEEILTNSQKIVLLDWNRQFDSIKKETNINNFIFEDRLDLKIKELYDQIFKGTNFDQNILPEEKLIFFEFIKENLKENLFYDQLQTDELKNRMLQQFIPKTINLTSGTVIIKKGELITAEKKRLILLIQKSLKENQLKLILNYLILFIITGSVLLFYLFNFANSFILYKRYSVYFFIILILSFGFYIFYELKTIKFIPVYFVFPLLLFYLLIEFAYSNVDRIIVYLSLIFILFLITNFDYILFYYGLILFTSLNFFPFQFSSYKKTIFSRVILSYTVTIIFSLLVNIIFSKSYKISDLIISGTLNIFISMILFFGLAPILENIFNFPTISKLLEICDLNNQFFSDFILKAPGTYHHSIIVANLAEKAAASCGANPYIARAGGLYHDIGKIRYSKYFVENQHGENPTVDILNPN
ncbi:MAG: HDIG domain-containing metalloprotein, partial [Exilispira sp.]